MKKLICAFFFSSSLWLSACTFDPNRDQPTENRPVEKTAAGEDRNKTEVQTEAGENEPAGTKKSVFDTADSSAAANACFQIETGEKRLLKSQTFPMNFPPYKNSCFVTAHNPDYTDPPLDSEFSIYKNGEEIFFFPNQFNGVTTGCWVEAVSFQDLNNDNLKDIVVVGKCSAKTAPYNENMVYVNTGTTFLTDENANYKLADFEKIKDITDFVRRNKQLFF